MAQEGRPKPPGDNGRRQRMEQTRLAATSVNPADDSIAIMKMRERMDSIRKAENRPTVAVVLSGGGAKGAAHLGTLKYLEEKQIPIDMILGTSIGGLVGGMYALGYDADCLDSLFRTLDWGKTLSDRVDPDLIPYKRKMRNSRYLVSLPFHYAAEDFAAKVGDGVRYSARRSNLNLSSAQEDDLVRDAASTTSFNSLPSGLVYGLNVNNLIAGKTVGYHDSLDFADLPVPFFCVASDLVSCKAKYWTSGPLNTALRSTMSIPVLFEPVRYEDMILADGGMRNNFPTDLARMMGADIIVGSVLSDNNLTYAQINNLADIAIQAIDMLSREAYEGNRRNTDIYLHPDVTGYSALSFSPAAIDTLLARGYRAAEEHSAELDSLKAVVGDATPRLSAPKALDIFNNFVSVSSIEFAGVDEDEARTLMKACRLREGDIVSNDEIEEAAARLFSLDALESVSYTLHREGDDYRLVFNCVKGPMHRIGVSARADTEELVAALFNVGFNVNRLHGSRLDFEGRIGEHWYGSARYSFSANRLPLFNFELHSGYTNAHILRDGSKYQAGYWKSWMDAYVSDLRLQTFDLRVGMRYNLFSLNSWLTNSGVAVPPEQMKLLRRQYGVAYMNARHYTLDNHYYPSKGVDLGAGMQWVLGREGAKVMTIDFRGAIPVNERFTVIPSVWSRNIVDAGSDNFYLLNYAGGSLPARYIDTQTPFVGFTGAVPLKNFALVTNLDLRFRVMKDFYATLQGGVIIDNDELFDSLKDFRPSCYGAAVELAYNSFIGPLRAKLQWSDYCGWGAYVGFGFDF